MKTEDYFKEGKNNIVWVGPTFKEHFYEMEYKPSKVELKFKTLERDMTDEEILNEFKPQEVELGDIDLKNENLLKNGYSNIFYVRDKNNFLWAVGADWDASRGVWYVFADSVMYPHWRNQGYQVVSQVRDQGYKVVSQVFGNLETRPLGAKSLEQRVKELEEQVKSLRKIINI